MTRFDPSLPAAEAVADFERTQTPEARRGFRGWWDRVRRGGIV
jgi:hypothetical protein